METDPLTAENADFGKIDDKYGAIPGMFIEISTSQI